MLTFSQSYYSTMLWIKRLFDSNFHQWKVMSLYLVRWYLGKNFKFHSNLEISRYVLRTLSKFYQGLFFRWGKYLCCPATLPSTVAYQFVQLKKHIKIDKKSICFNSLLNNNLNFVGQPFDFDGSIKSQWECLKTSFDLKITFSFIVSKICMVYQNFGKIISKTLPEM